MLEERGSLDKRQMSQVCLRFLERLKRCQERMVKFEFFMHACMIDLAKVVSQSM